MLEEKKIVDKIEIIGDVIQVRERICILKDGIEIASNFHRISFSKHDEITINDEKVLSIAKAIWPDKFLTTDTISGSI